MSGAAINIIVAPWFERRRGLAVSWALNGASAGGVVIAPALTLLTSHYSFGLAVAVGGIDARHPDARCDPGPTSETRQ